MLNTLSRWAAVVGVALVVGGATGATRAETADEAAIRLALERWTEEFNARRPAEVCGLFASDLIASYQGQPERGHDAVCRRLLDSLSDASRSYRYDLRLQEILVSGDLAVVRLVWTLTLEEHSTNRTLRVEEPGLDVFRRHPDGRWRIIRYLAYPAETR